MSRCAHCGFEFPQEASSCPACGRPLAPPVPRVVPPPIPRVHPPAPLRRPNSKLPWGVFFALGCAAAVPLLGIVAAIVIPNFLDAVQRAKTKRTMADIRLVGNAIESYRVETSSIPPASTIDELAPFLEPTYLAAMPRMDGWTQDFVYRCWSSTGGEACDTYRLASRGRDGELELDDLGAYRENQTAAGDYGRDIVYGDGMFIQFPGGPHSGGPQQGGPRRATPPPPPPDPR
jgi:type II secretory pathway pseudopilin PulG